MSDNKFQAALKAAPTVNMSAAEAEALPELTLDDELYWSGEGSHLSRWPGKFPESKQQQIRQMIKYADEMEQMQQESLRGVALEQDVDVPWESAMGEPRTDDRVYPYPDDWRSELGSYSGLRARIDPSAAKITQRLEDGLRQGIQSELEALDLDSDDGEYFSERMGGGPRKVSPRYLRDAGDRVNRHAQDLGFPAQYSAPPGLHEEVVAWEEAAIADLNRRAALKPTLAQKINKALFPQDWE